MMTTNSTFKLIVAPALCVGLVATAALTRAAHQSVPIAQGNITLELELVADGLVHPLKIVNANDASGRIFIVDQVGLVHIVDDGVLLSTPFLDISDQLPTLSTSFDERGLLGLAFHPDYANNGRLFARYSRPRPGSTAPADFCWDNGNRGCHREIVAEFAVSADPNVADPTPRVIFEVDQPQFNHDGGDIGFGPDGYLYFAFGDGGGSNDSLNVDVLPHGPTGHGQNIHTALGAMLRIDVDTPAPADRPHRTYAIPGDNPFLGQDGLDEIYAYGFRNPFRFSWDREDGRLFVADVGQGLFEEVDIVALGGNYGWVTREGFKCFDPFNNQVPPASCPNVGPLGEPLIDPIAEYDHRDGISIAGGNVYRGTQSPLFVGKYIFGDWSLGFVPANGRLLYLDSNAAAPVAINEFFIKGRAALGEYVLGFGEGEDGEIYVGTTVDLAPIGTSGAVYRLVESFDTDDDGVLDVNDNCSQLSNQDQTDSDSDGFGNRCDPDLNQDNVINAQDLGMLRLAFGSSPDDGNWNAAADFNANDEINAEDLGIMRSFFFGSPGPGAAGP